MVAKEDDSTTEQLPCERYSIARTCPGCWIFIPAETGDFKPRVQEAPLQAPAALSLWAKLAHS